MKAGLNFLNTPFVGIFSNSVPALLNPSFWWDSQHLSASNFIDRSNNGISGSNSNTTVINGVVHGLPIVRYNGTTSGTVFPTLVTTTNFTFFTVLKYSGSAQAAAGIGGLSRQADANYQILFGTTGPALYCYNGSTVLSGSVVDDYDNFSSLGVVCNNGTCSFYQNGNPVGVAPPSMIGGTVNIFGGFAAAHTAQDVAEVILWKNIALNQSQVYDLSKYFKQRYNL